jgi:hypothetical protein
MVPRGVAWLAGSMTCMLPCPAGEIAAHRELQAQITFYERSMSKAQALQAAEAAKLEGMLNQVDLAQAALSQAASDLAAASNNTAAAQEELRKRR